MMTTRTLNLKFVDIVGIRVKPLVHIPNNTNDNSQIKNHIILGDHTSILVHKCMCGAPKTLEVVNKNIKTFELVIFLSGHKIYPGAGS